MELVLDEQKSKVREGYKKTINGDIIPLDWEDLIIQDLMSFSGGSQPPRETFIFKPKEGYIRLLQIRDYKSDKFETYIPTHLARKFCNKNDIMIGRYGPPIFQILRGLEGAYNVALIKVLPQPKLDKGFAYHFLKQDKLFQFVEKLSQRSSGQTGVDLKELKQYPIYLPSTLAEQKAITKALSDVDALISNLENLITKKKAIKQGAMQQLLKSPKQGGKRLPGFEGEWEEKELGTELNLISGYGFSKSEYKNSGVKLLRIDNVSHGYISWDSVAYLGEDYLNKFPNLSLEEGDILLALNRPITQGKLKITIVSQNDLPAILYQRVGKFILLNNRNDKLFLYHLLSVLIKEFVEKTSVGTDQPFISTVNLKKLKLSLPQIEEQKAIATILSDMDAEIENLEKKKAKYQSIKQGMMQELLTGKTRLV